MFASELLMVMSQPYLKLSIKVCSLHARNQARMQAFARTHAHTNHCDNSLISFFTLKQYMYNEMAINV